MSLWINVEATPGSDIGEACKDAIGLADKLGHTVCFDFNGVHVMAHPNTDPVALEQAWHREIKRETPYKIASVYGQRESKNG